MENDKRYIRYQIVDYTIMKIAIIGGTGKIGEGYACRWAPNHEILLGSREIEKANEAAFRYECQLEKCGLKGNINGATNTEAAENAEVVVLSLPYEGVIPILEDLKDHLSDQIVISLVVPMKKNKWFKYTPPSQGSAAVMIQDMLPGSVKIVSAYHNISFRKLCDLNLVLDNDVVVCSDYDDARKVVMDLTREIRNLRPLDGGPLESSYMIEALTPFLLNLSIRNGLSDLGVKFV